MNMFGSQSSLTSSRLTGIISPAEYIDHNLFSAFLITYSFICSLMTIITKEMIDKLKHKKGIILLAGPICKKCRNPHMPIAQYQQSREIHFW